MILYCVCTGNTCRSPMAAALLRRALDRRGRADVTVRSAGLYADGSPATANAAAAMAEIGLDLSGHRSAQATPADLRAADGIFVMTPSHRQALIGAGIAPGKIYLPSPPIPDPFGGDIALYRATRDALEKAVDGWLDVLFPPVAVRPMTAADAPALAAIERACFAHPWSEAGLREEADNPAARFLVAEREGGIAGYAGMHIAAGEGYLDNVAVAPAHRRQGVARALMAALIAAAKREGLTRLSLEVRPSNTAAVALYEGAGFTRAGLRPGFYRDPTEDAAIYEKILE
ncbi:MAG: ribosomal protein S18-alanine N-acetyltransferase [Acutalibacteraceae bacterium]